MQVNGQIVYVRRSLKRKATDNESSKASKISKKKTKSASNAKTPKKTKPKKQNTKKTTPKKPAQQKKTKKVKKETAKEKEKRIREENHSITEYTSPSSSFNTSQTPNFIQHLDRSNISLPATNANDSADFPIMGPVLNNSVSSYFRCSRPRRNNRLSRSELDVLNMNILDDIELELEPVPEDGEGGQEGGQGGEGEEGKRATQISRPYTLFAESESSAAANPDQNPGRDNDNSDKQ